MVRTKPTPEHELANLKIKYKYILDGKVENDELKIHNLRTIVLPSIAEPIFNAESKKHHFLCKFVSCVQRQFATKQSLIRHIRTVHVAEIPGDGQYLAPNDSSIKPDGYICGTCKRHFLRKDKYNDHLEQGCSARPSTSTQLQDKPLFEVDENNNDTNISTMQVLSQSFSTCSIKDAANDSQATTILEDSGFEFKHVKPKAKKRSSIILISKREFDSSSSFEEDPVPIKRARKCENLLSALDTTIWESSAATIKRTTSLTSLNKPKPFSSCFFASQGNLNMEID